MHSLTMKAEKILIQLPQSTVGKRQRQALEECMEKTGKKQGMLKNINLHGCLPGKFPINIHCTCVFGK